MSRDRQVIDNLISSIEKKWQEKAFKGDSWKILTDAECLDGIHGEEDELIVSVINREWDNAMDEAADVAIYSAFMASPVRSNIVNFPRGDNGQS